MEALKNKIIAMSNVITSIREKVYDWTFHGTVASLKTKIFEKVHDGILPQMQALAIQLYEFIASVRSQLISPVAFKISLKKCVIGSSKFKSSWPYCFGYNHSFRNFEPNLQYFGIECAFFNRYCIASFVVAIILISDADIFNSRGRCDTYERFCGYRI